MSSSGSFFYPNVSSIPKVNPTQSESPDRLNRGAIPGEFDQILNEAQGEQLQDLNSIRAPLKFSAHASQRLQDRNIPMDPTTLARVNEAVDKAAAKGVEDALVITKDAALIVSVKNRTVVTALDRDSLNANSNVFTNIDGAVIV